MPPHPRAIVVTQRDRAELERVLRSTSTTIVLRRHAHAVLLMADGLPGVKVAIAVGYSPVQVSRIRRRFAETGVRGLADRRSLRT
jgi:hypothetical protein